MAVTYKKNPRKTRKFAAKKAYRPVCPFSTQCFVSYRPVSISEKVSSVLARRGCAAV